MNSLADKGYHTGEQLKHGDDHNITCYVSPKAPATADRGAYVWNIQAATRIYLYLDEGKTKCPFRNKFGIPDPQY